MLTRLKLKLGEGELVEANPEIERVYPRREMAEQVSSESDSQFIDSFMTMRAMVEEMYREFKKGRGECTSTSKQEKGEEKTYLGAQEVKGKGEKLPPSSPPPSLPSSSSPIPEE